MRILSIKKTAGIWALPDTPAKAERIKELINILREGHLPENNDVEQYVYNLLGDDNLFDAIDRLEDAFAKQCAKVIVKRIAELAAQPQDSFKNPQVHAMLNELARTLSNEV